MVRHLARSKDLIKNHQNPDYGDPFATSTRHLLEREEGGSLLEKSV